MKSIQLLLYIFSLLFTSLLPAKVYADQSAQTMGSNNKNSPQINGDGNVVYENCNNCNIYPSTTSPTVNQANSVPKTTESTHSSNSGGGLTPTQTKGSPISLSDGLTPTQTEASSMSLSDGLTPTQISPHPISKP